MNKTVAIKTYHLHYNVYSTCEGCVCTLKSNDRWVIVCSASLVPPIKMLRKSNSHIHIHSALCEWTDCTHQVWDFIILRARLLGLQQDDFLRSQKSHARMSGPKVKNQIVVKKKQVCILWMHLIEYIKEVNMETIYVVSTV